MSEYSRTIWLKLKVNDVEPIIVRHLKTHDWLVSNASANKTESHLTDTWAKDLDFIELKYTLRTNAVRRQTGTEVTFTVSELEHDFSQAECERKCNSLIDSISKNVVVARPMLMVESLASLPSDSEDR
jgi:hypothetical protein